MLVAVIGAIVSIFTVAFSVRTERKSAQLEERIAKLETKIEPFWELIQKNVSKLFHSSPNHRLLLKLNKGVPMSEKEKQKLKTQLKSEMQKAPANEKVNYLLAMWILETN